jgi:hypothetical protein
LKHLLGIYSRAPEVILKMGEPDFKDFDKYVREIIAQDFRQFLLDNGHIESYKDKIARGLENCRLELEKYHSYLEEFASGREQHLITRLGFEKPGRGVFQQMLIEFVKQKTESVMPKINSLIDSTTKQIAVYSAFPGIYEEVKNAVDKEIHEQKKSEFERLAQENLKLFEAEIKPRKINLSPELEKLARFAFLFQQWEEGYKKYRAKEKGYGEFFKEQWNELNPLFSEVVTIEEAPKKLTEIVKRSYITDEQAKQASSYLELAVQYPEKDKVRDRETLKILLKERAVEPARGRLTGEEVRMFVPGLSEDLAEAIAKHLGEETLLERHSKLSSLLPEKIAQGLFAANSDLLIADKNSFEDYCNQVTQYLSGEENRERALERIENDVRRFSDAKELRHMIYSRYSKAPQIPLPQQKTNEYAVAFANAGYDLEFVKTMITNGMRLGKKCFGESYLYSKHLRRNMRSFFKKNPQSVKDFDRTRDWLVSQGVIIHHHGKGKSKDESTVSLNPHLSEIKWAPLRDYVGDIFSAYGILQRNGDN